MVGKVFLLGRPGSGKTTAFQRLKDWAQDCNLQAHRLREYTFLYAMFQESVRQGKRNKFRAAEHGGFDILDFSILNKSARQLEKGARSYIQANEQKNGLLFIELARDNYRQTLQRCFHPNFLKDAYFLYIEADIEKCVQRIHHRVACPSGTDGHFISEYILREHYAKDNKEFMRTCFQQEYEIQKKIAVIENNGSYKEFYEDLKPFADLVFSEILAGAPIQSANTRRENAPDHYFRVASNVIARLSPFSTRISPRKRQTKV